VLLLFLLMLLPLMLLPLRGTEVREALQLLHCFSDFNFLQKVEGWKNREVYRIIISVLPGEIRNPF